VSASRDKGTAWETAIVRYLGSRGLSARRKAQAGNKDEGDIEVTSVPGILIEAKNCKGQSLAQWVDEAELEAVNAGGGVAVVWHHRRLAASPGGGYVTMSGLHFANLLSELQELRDRTQGLEASLAWAEHHG
jgi:hypothetical protein